MRKETPGPAQHVGAKLPHDLLERVRQHALETDRSVSQTIRVALKRLLEDDRKPEARA